MISMGFVFQRLNCVKPHSVFKQYAPAEAVQLLGQERQILGMASGEAGEDFTQ